MEKLCAQASNAGMEEGVVTQHARVWCRRRPRPVPASLPYDWSGWQQRACTQPHAQPHAHMHRFVVFFNTQTHSLSYLHEGDNEDDGDRHRRHNDQGEVHFDPAQLQTVGRLVVAP